MLGKPVIRGTRIPVELILRRLAEGASERDIREAYRQLEREDIRAARAYRMKLVAAEKTAPLPRKRARS